MTPNKPVLPWYLEVLDLLILVGVGVPHSAGPPHIPQHDAQGMFK